MEFNDYNEEMSKILSRYHDTIEEQMFPKLLDSFTKMYMGITELQGKLKARGLIKDDPYMKTTEFTEIILPESEPYIESEESWKSDERFYHYVSVLSYIIHNYNFSLGTLNIAEIEKIKKFLDYYQWKGLMNPTTTEFNTRVLGKKVISLRSATNDRLVISTIDKCVENIDTSYDAIIDHLKHIFLYLKESYKQFIRGDLLPLIEDNTGLEYSQVILLKKIKKEIDEKYSYLKFYKKYIAEVLDEEFSKNGLSLKNDILKKFSFLKMVPQKKESEEDNKEKLLLNLLLELGKIRKHINLAIEKINENHSNLLTKSGSFISRILKSLSMSLFNIKPKTNYKISITINKKGDKREENLNYEKFYEKVKHTEFILLPFSEEDRASAYIESVGDNVPKELDKILLELKKEIKYLISLDEFFKIELKAKGQKSRGIKPELTVLKSLLNSVTLLYKEFLDYL